MMIKKCLSVLAACPSVMGVQMDARKFEQTTKPGFEEENVEDGEFEVEFEEHDLNRVRTARFQRERPPMPNGATMSENKPPMPIRSVAEAQEAKVSYFQILKKKHGSERPATVRPAMPNGSEKTKLERLRSVASSAAEATKVKKQVELVKQQVELVQKAVEHLGQIQRPATVRPAMPRPATARPAMPIEETKVESQITATARLPTQAWLPKKAGRNAPAGMNQRSVPLVLRSAPNATGLQRRSTGLQNLQEARAFHRANRANSSESSTGSTGLQNLQEARAFHRANRVNSSERRSTGSTGSTVLQNLQEARAFHRANRANSSERQRLHSVEEVMEEVTKVQAGLQAQKAQARRSSFAAKLRN